VAGAQLKFYGKVRAYDSNEFFISEAPAVDVIADALRQAITMCRE
jgi:hypothetical protein